MQLFDRVHVFVQKTSFGINQLIILPTIDVTIVSNKNVNLLTTNKLNGLISHYQFNFNGKIYNINTEDVWTMTTASLSGDSFLYPDRKLDSLLKSISNIELNYKSRNELMKGLGAVGMISSNQNFDGQSIPLEEEEIKELQDDFAKYRLADGDYKYLITKSNLKWTPMTVAVKEMEFWQGLKIDTLTICDVLNYPSALLSSSQLEVKYSNFNETKKILYTDKIIPNATEIDYSFNQYFAKEKEYLQTDYSHLQVLQKDKKETAETNLLITDNITKLNEQINLGIITKEIAINQLLQQGYTEENANLILI